MVKENPLLETNIKVKVYKKRWVVLFVFCINSMANALLFTSITSINAIVCRYYDISPELTDWAANSFTVVYIFIALPSAYCMDSFGIKTLLLFGSSFNAICVCFHMAGTSRENGIWWVLAGQFVGGFSVGAVLQIPTRISSVWFPESEHAKATSIAMAFNVLGLGVGYIQPSYMVPDSQNMDDIYSGLLRMNITHLVFLAICLISCYVFFEEKPSLPPSFSAAVINGGNSEEHVDAPGFKASLFLLLKDKNFVILIFVYGLQFGLYNFFITCLNEMSSNITNESNIGWIGFFGNIASIVGILMFATILDRLKCYRSLTIFLFTTNLLTWMAFSATLLYWKTTILLYVTFLTLCFFGVPFMALGLEYAAEISYPVPEGLSSAVVLIAGNLVGLTGVLLFGQLIDENKIFLTCSIIAGLYLVALVLSCFIRPELKRSSVDSNFHKKPYQKDIQT